MDVELLKSIESVGGRLEKEALLGRADASTRRFLRWALDPFSTFGVRVDDDATRPSAPTKKANAWWDMVDLLLTRLSTRELTGNAAQEEIDDVFDCAPSQEHQAWARRVLNKDLRIGVAKTATVKMLPGLIEPFACTLAHKFEPGKTKLPGAWAFEPKLDGLRCVVVDGVPRTRSGHEITSVAHVVEALRRGGGLLLRDWVLDGEMMGADGSEFNESSGKIRKDEACESLIYNVFDVVDRGEWQRRDTRPFMKRRSDLVELLEPVLKGTSFVRVVPQVVRENPTADEVQAECDRLVALGFEGVMVKRMAAAYCFKRSRDVLKRKLFETVEGKVVGTYPGEGKYRGMLGGLVVSFPPDEDDEGGKWVETEVGSGLTDEQRSMPTAYWLEKVVEVQHQPPRQPSGKLRIPTLKRLRMDKAL